MSSIGTRCAGWTMAAVVTCATPISGAYAQLPSSSRDSIEGKWAGMAGLPTDRVAIAFEIKRDSLGKLRAYLYQQVANFYGLQLPGEIVKQGDKYVLKEWALNLTPKDGGLEGTLYSIPVPVSLARATSLPSEVPVPDLPRGPGPKWQTKLGAAIYAPAAVRDGVAYVGTAGGMFYAVSLADGKFVWAFAAGRPVFGGAALVGDALFFVCDNGFLFRLDRRTGKELWRYNLGDASVPRILLHQVIDNSGDFDFDTGAPTPTIAEGVVYVGSGDGSVHAVDATSGKRIWRAAVTGKVRVTAIVDPTRVIVGTVDNFLYALDRKTGADLMKWDSRGPIVTAPALIDDKLIVGNRNGLLAARNFVSNAVVWRMQLWGSSAESEATPAGGSLFLFGSSDLRRVALMDSKDGRVIWRTDVFGWAWPRPALEGNTVFVSTVGGSPYQMRHLGALSALDRATGRILWRWPMPEWPGSWTNGFIASPTVAENLVVVGGLDGSLYAFPVR
jgi:outer membrane protein assembly factor BamB